jgi:site-specific DNA recombinase
LRLLVSRADLARHELRAEAGFARLRELDLGEPIEALAALPRFTIVAPLNLQRRGPELRLVLGGAAAPATKPDPTLLRTLADARRRAAVYFDPDSSLTVSDIASRDGADVGDVSRSLQLAFLAPDLVEAILDGAQPAPLTAERLKRLGDLPLLWEEQRSRLA